MLEDLCREDFANESPVYDVRVFPTKNSCLIVRGTIIEKFNGRATLIYKDRGKTIKTGFESLHDAEGHARKRNIRVEIIHAHGKPFFHPGGNGNGH